MQNTAFTVASIVCLVSTGIFGGLALDQRQQIGDLETELAEFESENNELGAELESVEAENSNLSERAHFKQPEVYSRCERDEPSDKDWDCNIDVDYQLYNYELYMGIFPHEISERSRQIYVYEGDYVWLSTPFNTYKYEFVITESGDNMRLDHLKTKNESMFYETKKFP